MSKKACKNFIKGALVLFLILIFIVSGYQMHNHVVLIPESYMIRSIIARQFFNHDIHELPLYYQKQEDVIGMIMHY